MGSTYRYKLTAVSEYKWNATAITTVATTYTILTSDDQVIANGANGAFTLTLPTIAACVAAGKCPKAFYIVSAATSSTNDITISPGTGDTIDSTTSFTLSDAGDWVIIQAGIDGDWKVIDTNVEPS